MLEGERLIVRIAKIVSGGQSGVDRAALDAARICGIPVGGWCPRGRRAEDGPIPPAYPLLETPSADYAQRTRWNVRDSDATLVLLFESPGGGTTKTIHEAGQLVRPIFIQKLHGASDTACVMDWLMQLEVQVLNVAGPRESEAPGIYAASRSFLEQLFCG